MIKRIRVQNWRTHKDSELFFSKGTNVLIGKMGSGKTSIMNAICFGLYGTFPELHRKETNLDSIIMNRPSEENEAKVELDFEYEGKKYKIIRNIFKGKKTNQAKLFVLKPFGEEKKLIAGPLVTQVSDRVEKILDLNYNLFSRAVYSEQNQIDFFLKLSPKDRKEKFDELLDLAKYEKARSNAVSVKNMLKKLADEKIVQLKEISQRFDLKELEKAKKKIIKLKKEIKKTEQTKESKKKTVLELEKKAKELEVKRKEFKNLENKKLEIKTLKERLKIDLQELEKKALVNFNDLNKTKQEITKTKQEIELLKEKESALIKIIQKIEFKENLLKRIDNEIKDIQEKLPNKASTEEKLKEQETELEKKIETLQKKETETQQKIENLLKQAESSEKDIFLNENTILKEKEFLKHLSDAKHSCPVCKNKLEEKKRSELINEKKASIKKAETIVKQKKETSLKERTKISEQKKILEELKKEINDSKAMKHIFADLKQKIKELIEKENEKQTISNELNEEKKQLTNYTKNEIEKNKKEKEEKIIKLEKTIELINKKEKLLLKEKEFQKIEKQLKIINFDEDFERNISKNLEKEKEQLNSLNREKEVKKETLFEVQELKKKIDENSSMLNKLEKQIKILQKNSEKMSIFVNALRHTQAELRIQMIKTINEALGEIWAMIYPYEDFNSIKMEIENGSYEVKIKTGSTNWQKIEGTLSGGERSAVALAIRIAFSLVLARNLSWIILDEPTHNLDSASVEKMAEMMREKLPEIVNQIFLITHDKEMEKAASSNLYLMEREKNINGITKPVELSRY